MRETGTPERFALLPFVQSCALAGTAAATARFGLESKMVCEVEVTMLPDDEQIRRRAYEIWEREGRPPSREAEHWRMAVEELSAQRGQTETQEVPATRLRGPVQLEQASAQPSGAAASVSEADSGGTGNVPAAPSPDPQSDPLGLAQPISKPAPRKRSSAGRGARRMRPDASSPSDADTKAPDRTR